MYIYVCDNRLHVHLHQCYMRIYVLKYNWTLDPYTTVECTEESSKNRYYQYKIYIRFRLISYFF